MKKINPQLLKLYYIDQKMSRHKISTILGVSQPTITRHLQYNGIGLRKEKTSLEKNEPIQISKKMLCLLYVEQQKSTYDIAKQFKCDPSTIFLWLKRYDIPTRSNAVANKMHGINRRTKFDINVVKKLAKSGLSIQEISEKLNISYGVTYLFCKKHKIDTPSISNRRKQLITDRAEQKVSTESLIDMYWNEGMTFKHISEKVNLTPGAICLRLARNKIPVRFSSQTRTQEFYKKHPEFWKKRRSGTQLHTDIERAFIRWAMKHNIQFKTQFQIDNQGHKYDFYLQQHNIIVECDGDRWHMTDEQLSKDEIHSEVARQSNYIIYRFLGSDIITSKGKCFDEIILNISS